MRLVRNNGYLKARQRAGRMMVLAGLLGLLVAVVTPFLAPTNYTIGIMGYFVLIVAFIFFNAGLQQTTKWSRMRPDRTLDDALRRLNDKYTLIHFPEVPGTRPEHVLVYPGGLVVLTTREVAGQITVENDRWRRRGGRLLRIFFMGGPPLGNPTAECRAQQQALRAFLEARDLPGADLIDGIIVFVSPFAELEVISSDITVVKADELLAAVRDLGRETALTTNQREAIVKALSQGDEVEGPIPLPSREPSRVAG